MELVKFKQARFEKNKLILNESISIDEWKELGSQLKQVEGSVQFWIGDWARFGDKKGFTGKNVSSEVYDELEEITGLERKTLQNYKNVAEQTAEVRNSSPRGEELSYTHYREVAKLTPEKQTEFLNKASDENLSVRDLRREINRDKILNHNPPMNEGKFRIFYADPPWDYNDKQDIDSLGGNLKHYPSMNIEDICNLPIKEMAEEDAVLFLWVTSPLLEESFKVINAWGFKYKTSFIWDKVGHNMGHYNSVRHELLLVCTKGSCTPDNIKLFDSVQSIEKTKKHSEKPEEFRNIIDTLYTKGKRIELFARLKNDNWESWGNEV